MTAGKATVEIDPYNDAMLVVPTGPEPARGRAVLQATHGGSALTLRSSDREIGFDVANIPDSQLAFRNSGGGACGAAVLEAGLPVTEFELRVRAAMPSSVIPLAPDRREIRWRHALYFAYHAEMGRIRLHPSPTFVSRTVMQSKAENSEDASDFFPAKGRNELYFVMELLDLGFSWFNKTPMVQSFDGVGWPPYDTPLDIDEPVEFYDTEHPDELRLIIHKNEMQIYDYQGVEIERLAADIDDDGLLRSTWRIRNQADVPIRAQWFALGNVESERRHPDQGARLLTSSGARGDAYTFDFVARVKPSTLTQFVAMNVVSLDAEPVVLGTSTMQFRFPVKG